MCVCALLIILLNRADNLVTHKGEPRDEKGKEGEEKTAFWRRSFFCPSARSIKTSIGDQKFIFEKKVIAYRQTFYPLTPPED